MDCGGGRDSMVVEVRFGEEAGRWQIPRMSQEDGSHHEDVRTISETAWNPQEG